MKIGYARVSTNKQNLDMQIEALKNFGCEKIFSEKVSGVAKKTEFEKALGILRKGDTLVVWKLDRLGRTVKQLLNIAETFEKEGITFVSITENFDTSTVNGKFIFNMFCLISQMERDILKERTLAGIKSAKERGIKCGRKPIDEKTIETALKMYYSQSFSVSEILSSTGISKSTLYKYINKKKLNER